MPLPFYFEYPLYEPLPSRQLKKYGRKKGVARQADFAAKVNGNTYWRTMIFANDTLAGNKSGST
jgi:hypothetical protein